MKITYTPLERMTLKEFADKHNLTLVITEHKTGGTNTEFTACFPDMKDYKGTEDNMCGIGDTPQDAVTNLQAVLNTQHTEVRITICARGTEKKDQAIPVPVIIGEYILPNRAEPENLKFYARGRTAR